MPRDSLPSDAELRALFKDFLAKDEEKAEQCTLPEFRRLSIERGEVLESVLILRRAVQHKEAEIEEMKQAIAEKQLHIHQLEAKNQLRRTKLQSLSDALAKKQALLQRHTEVVQLQAPLHERYEQLRETVNLFATWMGLELKPEPMRDKSEGQPYRAFFSLLDPKQPERTCSFLLSTDADRLYHVTDCNPPVADLEQLVLELNEADNLSRFFYEMRCRFKAVLNPT